LVVLLNPADADVEIAVQKLLPNAKLMRTHRNVGCNPGKNLAIANTNGEFVFTIDDDAYFLSNDVISKLVDAFESEPELGAAVCNIEGPAETTYTGEDRYLHVYKDGFVMVPRTVFTDWVGYYPDLFFRSGSETYTSTRLWDIGKRVKCIVDARMYHDLSRQGRSNYAWRFYGLRSQALCAVMREPWFIVPFSLGSKLGKSLISTIWTSELAACLHAWWSFLVHLPEVWPQRQPIRWATYRLLRHLQARPVTSLSQLNPDQAESQISVKSSKVQPVS
jgi:GT2 family glycosyltransferase